MNELAALAQVIFIDLVLAGDNAVVIGALAAGLPAERRRAVILCGVILAVAARLVLSLAVVWLLLIPGIRLIGGALLLWVSWKMWRDLRDNQDIDGSSEGAPSRGFVAAILAVVVADISMSLDNVLAVAGVAAGHIPALIVGLALSMALMGIAANVVAKIINRHKWIAYVGLALIVFVAVRMVAAGLPL